MKGDAKRLVLLVPTARDMSEADYLETYWPNFVCAVRDVLKRADIKCEVRVVAPIVRPAEEPKS